MSEVTQILESIERGDTATTDRLLPLVYDELRRIAASKLKHEAPGQTMQTTALVHEAYLRLLGGSTSKPNVAGDEPNDSARPDPANSELSWDTRGHFFAAAAESMRRILVDNARRKKQLKRGGDRQRIEFEGVDLAAAEGSVDLESLDEALSQLEAKDELKAQIVKLRFFAGLTVPQTARALGVSEPTVKRHWQYSRAWLRREMGGEFESQ